MTWLDELLATTRDGIAAEVRAGIADGLTGDELGARVGKASVFDETTTRIVSEARYQPRPTPPPIATEVPDADRLERGLKALAAFTDAMSPVFHNTVNVPEANVVVNVPPATINVAAPQVHVAQPEVNVAAPNVTVESPNVTFQAPEGKAGNVQDIRIVEMPRPAKTKQRVKRDTAGRIIEIVDE